ncbi:MAG: DNA repair protein RadC [Candidatus Eremiobacteraeota bacterium]|nr:DNA repair protein RadC [Candidatus Eremiobacteraeota bacterium]
MKAMAELNPYDRPREKILEKGPQALSDAELLALVMGSGTRGAPVMTVARKILKVLDRGGESPDPRELRKIHGVGEARAFQILAALEFSRRRIRPEGLKIAFPADVLPWLSHFSERKQEHFIAVTLNGAHEVISTRVVTVGLVDKTHVHPREIFADAITDRASSLIVAHNHPSGSLEPSAEDAEVTCQLRQAGEMLGIRLLDHIIFSRRGYYSFLEKGRL